MSKIVIAILVGLFFVIRDAACFYFFPDMKIREEWNGANELTMNAYAVIIGLSFVSACLKTKYQITLFFTLIPVWFSVFDLVDRSFKIYELTSIDRVFVIPASIFLAALTYAIITQIYDKRSNRQSN